MSNFVTWYKDEPTFLRFKEVCEDKDSFGPSYPEWVAVVQKKIDEVAHRGIHLVKVHIEPEAFYAWCVANAKVPNASSRAMFCGVVYGDAHGSGSTPVH